MAHTLPPTACTTNLPTWTTPTLSTSVTTHRKVHLDELRSYINAEFTRRGLATTEFTDPTITANETAVRAAHITELRAAVANCKTGYSTANYCPGDNSGCADWATAITENVTATKGSIITELRTKVQAQMTACVCETEQCQYCADCGYQYWQACGYCGCQDRCGSDGAVCSQYWVYLCGSINTPAGTANPFKSWNGSVSAAWDGTVPWDWGAGIPAASIAWRTPKESWNCKCNPYAWDLG